MLLSPFSSILIFSFFSFCPTVLSGTVSQGAACSTTNDHIDPASHKFVSQCDTKDFCTSINGTCVPRLCRRDEFPFGYASGDSVPPLCPGGSFCPDQGNGCKAVVSVGQRCQLDRDEQCAPPSNWQELESSQNSNGSICLNSQCMYANVTLGQHCAIENTTYIDTGPDNQQYSTVIIRDDCQTPEYYCDIASVTCMNTKGLGYSCQMDRECITYNCNPEGVCDNPPETPARIATWQYVVTVLCIISAILSTCMMLTIMHKRHRLVRYKEIREYYTDQVNLRRSIIALHSAALEKYS